MSEIFNFDSVVELLMGDEGVAKELLKSYLSQTEEQMKLLYKILISADFNNNRDEVRRKAHLIKGSSLNVSAKDIGSTMLEMEKSANTLSREELLALYEVAQNKFEVLREEIFKFLLT